MGMRNLMRRKTRTFLTVTGVVVGATAIVIMLSLGIGMNENLERMIENMGDLTIIEVQNYTWSQGENDEWNSHENKLNDELIEQIRQLDNILAVTPYISMYGSMNWGNLSIHAGKRYQLESAEVIGVDPSFLPYLKIELDKGEMPDENDKTFILFGADRVVYFLDPNKPVRDYYKEFYNKDGTLKPPKVDVLTQGIYIQGKYDSGGYWDVNGNYVQNEPGNYRFKKYTFDKTGIMKADETGTHWETRYAVYVDIETMKSLRAETEKANRTSKANSQVGKYDRIKIKVKDIESAEEVQQQLTDMGITIVNSLSDIRTDLQGQQATTQMILGGIGAMSLIVAAIGIANTMYMSIYERTKEIGVMKVLGCPVGGIKSMFLFEASIIGFLGGIFGVALSLAGSYAMNNVEFLSKALSNMGGTGAYSYYNTTPGNISVIPMWLIALAIIFSTVIGLASGYLPARRATKISALEAIRNE